MKAIKKYSVWIAGAVFVVMPAVVFAQQQNTSSTQTIPSILGTIARILNDAVIPLVIGLAFVVFLWGIFKYVTAASLEGKAGAKETIIYGLIGLFIMLAAWGLVKILIDTFFTTQVLEPPWIPGITLPS